LDLVKVLTSITNLKQILGCYRNHLLTKSMKPFLVTHDGHTEHRAVFREKNYKFTNLGFFLTKPTSRIVFFVVSKLWKLLSISSFIV